MHICDYERNSTEILTQSAQASCVVKKLLVSEGE